MNILVKNKEGYAIRFYSNETQPDDDGIQVSARRGYVLSPCLYPEPLAKAIVPLIQKHDTENTYYHFWLPNLDEMYVDITKQKLHTKSIEDFYFIHDLPEKIGDDWEAKPAIVGISENGSLSVKNPLNIDTLDMAFWNKTVSNQHHFYINKDWTSNIENESKHFISKSIEDLPIEERVDILRILNLFIVNVGNAKSHNDHHWQSQFVAHQSHLPDHLQGRFLDAYRDFLMCK